MTVHWPAVFCRLPADFEIVMFDADIAGGAKLLTRAMTVLVGPARVRVNVSARITWQLAGDRVDEHGAVVAIRALAYVQTALRMRADAALAEVHARVLQLRGGASPWPSLFKLYPQALVINQPAPDGSTNLIFLDVALNGPFKRPV